MVTAMKILSAACLYLTALIIWHSPVHAADLIDISGDWQAFKATDEKGRLICFAGSHPVKSEGKYTKRGEPFIMITHWPSEKTFGEVRFDAGYSLSPDAPVRLMVGKESFTLDRFSGESAWAPSAKIDAAVVKAMKAGAKMVISGVSSRGTHTADTFSLKGSSAAFKAIDRACKR